MAAQLEITALFTYPVKSCRAIPHREIALDDWGMSWDRRWMVVDAEGQFLTQRTYPRMAQIDVAISAEALSIHAPGQPVLRVPLDAERSPLTQVVVWRDATEAWDEGDAAADWFSRFLGDSVRMVRMPDDFVRPVNPKYATKPSRVSFADAYPVLVASEESTARRTGRSSGHNGSVSSKLRRARRGGVGGRRLAATALWRFIVGCREALHPMPHNYHGPIHRRNSRAWRTSSHAGNLSPLGRQRDLRPKRDSPEPGNIEGGRRA
jgi:hypothetical protein